MNGTDTQGIQGNQGTQGAPSVIVVGAGPTGLLLAGDLATAGVPVTLLDKRPREISNLSRAFVLHARTLEELDARDLADRLESVGRPWRTSSSSAGWTSTWAGCTPASGTSWSSRSTRSRRYSSSVPNGPG